MNAEQNTLTQQAVRRYPGEGGPDYARPPMPMREIIARRAYEIWQQRGCQHGADLRDWHEAEDELKVARFFRYAKRR